MFFPYQTQGTDCCRRGAVLDNTTRAASISGATYIDGLNAVVVMVQTCSTNHHDELGPAINDRDPWPLLSIHSRQQPTGESKSPEDIRRRERRTRSSFPRHSALGSRPSTLDSISSDRYWRGLGMLVSPLTTTVNTLSKRQTRESAIMSPMNPARGGGGGGVFVFPCLQYR